MFLVPYAWCLVSFVLFLISCSSIDLYEKSVAIPGHSWKSGFKPSFTFTIKDTVPSYQLYLILRHNDKYNYNNIYVTLHIKQPNQDSIQSARYDLPLANNENGWLASGMDDIYEHRIPLTASEKFKKPGNYIFTIEQIMREDPLKNVLDVGLRIEKKQ